MTRNIWPVVAVLAAIISGGCSSNSTESATPSHAGASPSASTSSATDTPASTAPVTAAATDPATDPGQPTQTQALICGDEIQDTVQQVLALPDVPAAYPTYVAPLYSCAYDLPNGPMKLSVRHLPTDADARTYLKEQSSRLKASKHLPGLGEDAYGDNNGTVLTIKDNEVLQVDTTALPSVFGQQSQRRTDLAYEIASDVLGCWTGDDS